MSFHRAYLYITRNMGKGYTEAYPPCNALKNWFFTRFLFQGADEKLAEGKREIGCENVESACREGLLSEPFVWKDWLKIWRFYAWKYELVPDNRCPDPLAKGRNPLFTMYIVMEGKLEIFPPRRLDDFVNKCIQVGLDTFTPGELNSLKIPIPENLLAD